MTYPWDYDLGDLRVLCRRCHEEHERVKIEVLRFFESFIWSESETFIQECREAITSGVDPEALLRFLRMQCSVIAQAPKEAHDA